MKIKVGIIGIGTVGMGVLKLIEQQHDFFSSKLGINIEIAGLCAKTYKELELVSHLNIFKTIHAEELCDDPEINIIRRFKSRNITTELYRF